MRKITLAMFLAILSLASCSVAYTEAEDSINNEQIEIEMRDGQTFCEAYKEIPYCGEQAEGYREDE